MGMSVQVCRNNTANKTYVYESVTRFSEEQETVTDDAISEQPSTNRNMKILKTVFTNRAHNESSLLCRSAKKSFVKKLDEFRLKLFANNSNS